MLEMVVAFGSRKAEPWASLTYLMLQSPHDQS